MVVERREGRESESGQSVLEFLLMLPMMVALVIILVRVNTVIQVSIVNQQYARAQALWLTFNSPVYPQLRLRESQLTNKQYNQMVIGVSDNPAPPAGDYVPKASVQNIARKKNPGGSNEAKEQPRERSQVRVRDTVTLCTQTNVVPKAGGSAGAILELVASGSSFAPKGNYALAESTRFDYCGGPMKYDHESGSGGI